MIQGQLVSRWLLALTALLSLSVMADGSVSKEKAVSLVEALPEVKAWARYVEEQSKGNARAAIISDDETTEVSGKYYWRVVFYESQPTHMHVWETFLVRSDGRVIFIENIDPDEGPLSLEQWRKTRKPLDRIMK